VCLLFNDYLNTLFNAEHTQAWENNPGLDYFKEEYMTNISQDASGHQVHNHQSRQKVRNSLKLSILDGSAYAAMLGFTQNFTTPFALVLQASSMQIGLLSSIPGIATAFTQLAAPGLAERAGNRKRMIMTAAFFHAMMWLPVFLVPYFFRSAGVWWLIGLVTICFVTDSMSFPPWGSMMADLVPEELRGRYFGFRGRIAVFITLVFSLLAGGILQILSGNVFVGFAVLFGGAAGFRLLSFFFLSRMYEPPVTLEKENAPGVMQIVRTLGTSNLGRYMIYIALIYFGMMLSGPFFSVFMLRDLHFNYLTYTIVTSASIVANLFFLPFWGRRADRAGNLKIVRITSWLMPVVPMLWLVSANPVYLVFANIVSGFTWSGFNLASVNFVFDASEPGNRTKQIAVFNSFIWLAICIGSLVGGYLIPHLPHFLGFQMRTLFTLSGVVRGVVVIVLLRTIVEVRHVPSLSAFSVLFHRPGLKEKVKDVEEEK
jgi:MFS family permease